MGKVEKVKKVGKVEKVGKVGKGITKTEMSPKLICHQKKNFS